MNLTEARKTRHDKSGVEKAQSIQHWSQLIELESSYTIYFLSLSVKMKSSGFVPKL